jgi:hypothetical protein
MRQNDFRQISFIQTYLRQNAFRQNAFIQTDLRQNAFRQNAFLQNAFLQNAFLQNAFLQNAFTQNALIQNDMLRFRSNSHSYDWGTGGKLRHKRPRPEFRGEYGLNPVTGRDEVSVHCH